MFLIRLSLGAFLIALGLGYVFDRRVVLRMNAFMREQVFRDSYVLLSGKRIGAALLAVGFFLVFMTLQEFR